MDSSRPSTIDNGMIAWSTVWNPWLFPFDALKEWLCIKNWLALIQANDCMMNLFPQRLCIKIWLALIMLFHLLLLIIHYQCLVPHCFLIIGGFTNKIMNVLTLLTFWEEDLAFTLPLFQENIVDQLQVWPKCYPLCFIFWGRGEHWIAELLLFFQEPANYSIILHIIS